MNPLFQTLFTLLAKLRFLRLFVKHCSRRWASFRTLLGRKLVVWGWLRRKLGTFLKPRTPGPLSPDPSVRVRSAPGYSKDLWEYVVTVGSTVPTSASRGRINLDEPSLAITSATSDQSLAFTPTQEKDQRDALHHGSAAHSRRSSASDRLSGITSPRDSWHSPLGQPSRATHTLFGRGPDPSRSRSTSRSPSPRRPPHATHEPSPAVPLPVSITRDSLSPPPSHLNRSHSLIFNVQNPSTESLPITFTTNSQSFTEGTHPVSSTTDRHEIASQHSLATSSVISAYVLPEGRSVQLIYSEQIPRHSKNIRM